jgi:hypothetical protein
MPDRPVAATPAADLDDDALREAARLAAGWRLILAAKAYGFITGGPTINEARIDEVLDEADRRGIDVPHEVAEATAMWTIAEVNA